MSNYNQAVMEGQTVLITGAAKRIGRNMALRFAKEGASLLLHYNKSVSEATELCDEIRNMGLECELYCADLSIQDEVIKFTDNIKNSKLISKRGGLDVLINSASIFEKDPLVNVTEEKWEKMMFVNAKAPYFITKYLLSLLVKNRGSVINMIDTSYSRPWSFYSNYCASKAALRSLTLSLAIELAPDVRVNGIAPGAIVFPEWMPDEERKEVLTNIPMRREGTVDEIAETVMFLASGPKYITGQIIAVDGGWSLID